MCKSEIRWISKNHILHYNLIILQVSSLKFGMLYFLALIQYCNSNSYSSNSKIHSFEVQESNEGCNFLYISLLN